MLATMRRMKPTLTSTANAGELLPMAAMKLKFGPAEKGYCAEVAMAWVAATNCGVRSL